ncbi:MAG: lysoplasmalogenase [Eubacteriales bacterium]|nr:lysoplasmalogenase [Christensenellaceae bacterium]MDY2751150.1 lysoplasmalogenase [Eubacteriales bacterium]MDD7092876.1 lysoplasmalogenase [Christensenellaceae bacterium]MDD7245571.1 lysoplasmalogenase [Christensenellaceae bacterium]MDY3240965.1 lysoplasmalogenase [Eubacteriales bacterium]
MAVIYVLTALTAVLSVVIVALENRGVLAVKYVLKATASLCFTMIAVLAILKSGFDKWKMLVLSALIFGMLGDIFLSSENVVDDPKKLPVLNVAGGAFFAVGHVVYVIWLLRFAGGFNPYTLFALFGVPVVFLALCLLKIMKPGKLLLPVIAYSAFLGLMLTASVNAYVYLAPLRLAPLILAGGILFTLSDGVLAYYNFGHKEQKRIKYVYMTAYYAAQLLFAYTLLF